MKFLKLGLEYYRNSFRRETVSISNLKSILVIFKPLSVCRFPVVPNKKCIVDFSHTRIGPVYLKIFDELDIDGTRLIKKLIK